ncbi:MAG: hypothetical protein ACI4EL_06165, partial [Candidatus Fimimorpha sp.]
CCFTVRYIAFYSPFVKFRGILYVSIISHFLLKSINIGELYALKVAYIPPPKGSGFYAPNYKLFSLI